MQVPRILLMILVLFSPARLDLHSAQITSGGENVAAMTNATPGKSSPVAARTIPPETKTQAGFLAAAGLVILSLLILAAGLALLRAFKQR